MGVSGAVGRARSIEIAGVLVHHGRRRAALISVLSQRVAAAVDECRSPSDAPGRWEPTWMADLAPWMVGHLAAIDRLRWHHDALLTAHAAAEGVCDDLVAAKLAPLRGHELLVRCAAKRAGHVEAMGAARRCLRPQLTPIVSLALIDSLGRLRAHERACAIEMGWLVDEPIPVAV